ncbi:YtxH domain-containing protein [Patescibacteria group bacterium]|nr:YtxH domain-containing protein [Patescibacteria group bacterium]
MKTKKFLAGLALGALVGSALGLFYSPDKGRKNREQFKKITKTVSEALIKEAAKVSGMKKKDYDAVVEKIVKKYSKTKLISEDAWADIKKELKMRWKDIQSELKKDAVKKKPARAKIAKAKTAKKK